MKKATYKDIPTFYKHKRYIDDKGNRGYLYYLSKILNDDTKITLKEKYNNIDFYICELEYAPEVLQNVIFLSDTILKGVK